VPTVGAAVIVTVREALALAQPPLPVTIYIIAAVPGAIPVTAPVEEFTEAIDELEDVQLPPGVVELNTAEPDTHIACVPLKVPALGGAVTVTVRVAVASAQLPVPVTVYVIVAIPAATPVTTPVDELIVATALADELQVPPVDVVVNVVVPNTQISCGPLSKPAVGGAVTVIARVDETSAQPPVPVTIYVIVAIPALRPLISPVIASIVAIVLSELIQEPPETVELKVEVPPTQIA
jgi:hypothetical protein